MKPWWVDSGRLKRSELICELDAEMEQCIPAPDDMSAANGLKTYGAYYVPAIAEEYIADMSTYDGSFN